MIETIMVLATMLSTAPVRQVLPEDRLCDRRIAAVVAGAAPTSIPAGCWRVGPLRLGMAGADVRSVLGAPVQTDQLTDDLAPERRYTAEIFAFPRRWRPGPTDGSMEYARLRFLEVLLEHGKVVQISNDIGGRTEASQCATDRKLTSTDTRPPTDFRPFQRFAGVAVGSSEEDLARRFGKAPARNASQDWLSYLPPPLTFDADPDSRRITGFAIGTDDEAVTTQDEFNMKVALDPKTCRPTAVTFISNDAPAAR